MTKKTITADTLQRQLDIEAALEKVRIRSMAMQSPEELSDVLSVLFQQFDRLKINPLTVWLTLWNPEKNTFNYRSTGTSGKRIQGQQEVDIAGMETWKALYDKWKSGASEDVEVLFYAKEDLGQLFTLMAETFESMPKGERLTAAHFPEGGYSVQGHCKFGYIGYTHTKEPTPEERNILKRFSTEFGRVYQRFLDLKKAEAQAREAQIEAALERVRAASLAMNSSAELFNVINILSEQLVRLGIQMDAAMINEKVEGSNDWYMWLAISSESREVYTRQEKVQVPYLRSAAFDRISRASREGKSIFSDQLTKAQKDLIFRHYFTNSNHKDVPQNRQDYIMSCPGLSRTTVLSDNSFIQFYRYSLNAFTEEENRVLERFGIVFEQSYTRFVDLQRAEAQAREAQIEAALERVRSRSMAMHSTEELLEVVVVLFNQLKALEVDFIQAWISIWHLDEGYFEMWLSPITGHGDEPIYHHQPSAQFEDTSVKSWLNGDRFSYVSLPGEEIVMGFLVHMDERLGGHYFEELQKKNRYSRLEFVDANHKYGTVSMSWHEKSSEEDRETLYRFARVFEQTYTRFLDLQRAEAQAREAKIEAALERVRSKTMAMHNSQDVSETVATLFEEVKKLGLDESIRCGIGILEGYEGMETWSANAYEDGDIALRMGMLNMDIHPMLKGLKKAWEKGESGYQYDYDREDVKRYYKALNKEPEYPFNADLKRLPEKQFHKSFFFAEGILFSFTENPLSEEASNILRRFTNVFGQTYRRYLDLQKAEAQARESQIEAALERIRARAMAMHSTDELTDVLGVLFDQFDFLGINPVLTHLTLFDEENETFTLRIATSGTNRTIAEQQIDVNAVEAWKNSFANWKKSELHALDCIDYPPEVLPYLWDVLHEVMNALPEDQRIYASDYPEGLYTTQGHCNYGYIGFNHSRRATEEEKELVVRFAKEFGRLYQRFLDIQKAEAQARESQIEAALERVRAKTMAMHNTEDIADMVTTFFNELLGLGIGNSARCGIGILNPSQVMQLWTASLKDEGDITLHSGPLDMRSHSLLQGLQKAWSQGESLFEYTLEGPEKLSYFKVINDAPEYPVKVALDKLPDSVWHNSFLFPNGTLFVFSESPIEEEIRDIFTRFASVFGQTYIRFLDLERAEKQARESRIEAALERVRAKAMAMHSSEDLRQTITVIFEELKKLEIQSLRLGLGLLDAKDPIGKIVTSRIDDKGEIIEVSGKFRLEGHPVLKEIYSHFRSQEDYFPVLEGDEIKSYYQGLQKSVDVEGLGTSSKHYGCFLYFPEGCLYAWAATPHSEEQISILRKFSRVVEITYRRYNDLVEAETREKEAVKQASLDRVRGEIASMRTTRDLERITPLVWKELTTLGIPFFRCGVFIMDEVNQMVNVYLTTPEGEALGAMDLPFDFDMSLIQKGVDHWRRQKILVEKWNQEQFVEMTQKLLAQGQVKNVKSYQAGETPPERLVLQQVPFAQGMLYVGSTEPLSGEEMDIVKALTRTFAIAYARYEDFSELEKAKKKIENTLTDLKATQAQLIQSEKMASLGELTAGIAHEIKNPLNFVNNFSEVSRELLVELMEEMENGDLEEVRALAGDIIQNLDKIVHHGQRADSIVKGMLQHSRSGDGKKEPTDLNELADEYLRLAYHGLRAKDKSFNARMETDFDDSLGNVDVVPQEIGRVLLNLLTNAFHAVKERKASEPEGYDPTVWVQTQKTISGFKISVRDNGKGIPDKIVDKIFQPFFTTKPTGEGTGLGLSLSYDIVKAHGGELKVETTQGEGTTFSMIFKTETT